jgi:rubrerythrin
MSDSGFQLGDEATRMSKLCIACGAIWTGFGTPWKCPQCGGDGKQLSLDDPLLAASTVAHEPPSATGTPSAATRARVEQGLAPLITVSTEAAAADDFLLQGDSVPTDFLAPVEVWQRRAYALRDEVQAQRLYRTDHIRAAEQHAAEQAAVIHGLKEQAMQQVEDSLAAQRRTDRLLESLRTQLTSTETEVTTLRGLLYEAAREAVNSPFADPDVIAKWRQASYRKW